MEERQTQQPSLPVEHHEDLEFFCPPESSPQLFSDSTEYYMSQAYKRSPPPLRAEFPDSESYEQEYRQRYNRDPPYPSSVSVRQMISNFVFTMFWLMGMLAKANYYSFSSQSFSRQLSTKFFLA